jgi:autotransporter-associated beta strand protein
LLGGIAITNNLAFRTRNYPAGFPAHYLNVNGTNVLNPPADVILGSGGNVISLESGNGHLILTKGVTTTASAPRYLALFGEGDGEVQGALSANMALFKGGGGTWTISGSSPMGGPTVVSNGTLVVNGSLTAPTMQVNIAGGTLSGNGTIAGSVTVDPDGKLAPGSSAGTLAVYNSLTLQGTTVMEIGRNGGSRVADSVAGINTVTYGGALIVTNIGTSPLQVGDTFQLFAATNYAGEFPSISYPDGYTFTNRLSLDGTIQVLTSPFVSPPTLSYAVSGGNWVFSWPGSGFKLQTQTNTLAVGLGTNWADVPGGETSGVAVQAPVAGNPAVFFRLISTP